MSAPAQAAAVGYNLNTFSSTLLGNTPGTLYGNPGFYGYNYTGGFDQNSDGSLTINGDATRNQIQLATGKYDTTKSPVPFSGVAFGGGAYFEAIVSWPPTSAALGFHYPDMGLYDLATSSANAISAALGNKYPAVPITGGGSLSIGATTTTLPGYTGTWFIYNGQTNTSVPLTATVTFSSGETRLVTYSKTGSVISITWTTGLTIAASAAMTADFGPNFGVYGEIDCFEFNTGVANIPGVPDAHHSWSGTLGGPTQDVHSEFAQTATVPSTAIPFKVGTLWVPATATAPGYLAKYLNDVQVGIQYWNKYDPTIPPPIPTVRAGFDGLPGQSPAYGTWAMSIIDTRKCFANWSTTSTVPLTLHAFNVWQTGGSNNFIANEALDTIQVQVIDSLSNMTYAEYLIPTQNPIVPPPTLANPVVGAAYSQDLTPTGGTAPYTASLLIQLSGPNSYTVSGNKLLGTPTTVGTDVVSIMWFDANNVPQSQVYTLTASAAPPSIPQPPTNLSGTSTITSVVLTWSPSALATSYRVYSSLFPAQETLLASGIPLLTFEIDGLTPATSYYFYVTAVNGNGESAPSSELSISTVSIPPPPPGPIRVKAVMAGEYLGDFKDVGDVFELVTSNDYSAYNVSQVPVGNPIYPFYGWMMQVPESTPLFSWASTGNSTPRNAPRRTVE
jgi:hypothetical protein